MSGPPPPTELKWISPEDGIDVNDPELGTDIKLREIFGTYTETRSAVGATPSYRVRVACPWINVNSAKARLLGTPAKWPKLTKIKNMYCVECHQVNDGSIGSSNVDKEVFNYQGNAFFDLTYAQRPGQYLTKDFNDEAVYWYDVIEHRNEGFPVNFDALVWGLVTDTTPTSAEVEPVGAGEAPVLYEGGFTLTHTIEGWTLELPEFLKADAILSSSPEKPLIGSCNAHEYVSFNLNRKFAVGTLMLRSIIVESLFSFRSYRFSHPDFDIVGPHQTPTHLERFDMSGIPTNTLKLVYEYRREGWARFRRTDLEGKVTGWYYMRYNDPPTYTKYEPFTLADHRIFLAYNTL